MVNKLLALVAGALTNVRNPQSDNDLISAGMVQDLGVDTDGNVSFTFALGREDPARLVREARRAVQSVAGVGKVSIDVIEPGAARAAPAAAAAAPDGAVPAAGPAPQPPQPATFDDLGIIIAVSSGKGGVGKSTVSANLAAELAHMGKRVGILDADVYGPNIPRSFGVYEKPPVRNGKIVPPEKHGVKLISLGFLIERDAPAIWRGPIIVKILNQFLRDVDWGKLDYLIVDLPPGTGDAQLSLAQTVQLKGAVIVTTPQEMAVGDGLRGAKMFERVGVPVLGIVENMSYFACPHCGEHSEIFTKGGGQRLAEELGVPLLGRIPLQAGMTSLADQGKPVVIAEPESPAAKALSAFAKELMERGGGRSVSLPVITG